MNRAARIRSGLLATALIAVSAPAAWAETRMALVIGNGDYVHGGKLANPPHDAVAISKALTSIGFTVVSKTDLGRDGMVDALKNFARDSADADVAVVYYAGHGLEIGGTNYLLPVDATLSEDTDVEFEAVPVDRVLTAVGKAHRLKVVILDACRNNPFLDAMKRANGQRGLDVGLARPVAPTGMVIAYAAREGSTSADGSGGDSPYATSLAHHLLEPGIDVRILFGEVHDDVLKETGGKQEPSDYDSIGGQGFYLIPPAGAADAPGTAGRSLTVAAQTTVATPDPHATEVSFWNKVDAKDPAQLRAYLDQYPKGSFASLAQAKLAAFKAVAPPPPPAATDDKLARAVEAGAKGEDAFRAQDYAEAMRQFKIAAELGHAAGAFRVGLLYVNGQGVPQDFAEAMKWYRQAAAGGSPKAMRNLGNLYKFGRGVPQDYAEAMRWYRMAADRGYADAEVAVGAMYGRGLGVPRDDAEALRWYRMAAEQNDAQAQTNIGVFYRDGRAVTQDYQEAAKWFRMAAAQSFAAGEYDLGLMLAHGQGVDRDMGQAQQLMVKAAAHGDEFAKAWLARKATQSP